MKMCQDINSIKMHFDIFLDWRSGEKTPLLQNASQKKGFLYQTLLWKDLQKLPIVQGYISEDKPNFTTDSRKKTPAKKLKGLIKTKLVTHKSIKRRCNTYVCLVTLKTDERVAILPE